ncbi:MAG: hypothetical protein NVSMB31_07200 [Vulcanimicrobiaceae bacterium]
MRRLTFAFLALGLLMTAISLAAEIPSADDPQGTFDETQTASWNGPAGAQHSTGHMTLVYHLDFWLVHRIDEGSYEAEGRFTFKATGEGSVTDGDATCKLSGTISGAGSIAADPSLGQPRARFTFIKPIPHVDSGYPWGFVAVQLPNLSNAIAAEPDAANCHQIDVPDYLVNFEGRFARKISASRQVAIGERLEPSTGSTVNFSTRDCSKLAMAGGLPQYWGTLPETGVRCSIHNVFQFTGAAATPGPGFEDPLPPKVYMRHCGSKVSPTRPPYANRTNPPPSLPPCNPTPSPKPLKH